MIEKAKTLLLSLTPIALMYIIQIAAALGGQILIIWANQFMAMAHVYQSPVLQYAVDQYVYIVSAASYGLFFLVGYFWYRRIVADRRAVYLERGYKPALDSGAIIGIFFTALFLQFAVSSLLDILAVECIMVVKVMEVRMVEVNMVMEVIQLTIHQAVHQAVEVLESLDNVVVMEMIHNHNSLDSMEINHRFLILLIRQLNRLLLVQDQRQRLLMLTLTYRMERVILPLTM